MKKILVCRIGAFGDICMTLPVVHSLSARFEVHWLIRQGHDAILKLFPEVKCHPVIFGAGPNVLSGLVSRLGAAQYDALLDFSNWEIIGRLASQLKGIPLRATAYDSTRRLVFQRMKNGLPWFRPFNKVVEIEGAVHRVFKWQQLIKASLGCTLSIHWPLEPVRIPEESVRIFVHPHASKPSKLWSLDNMAAVLRAGGRAKDHPLFHQRGASRGKESRRRVGIPTAPSGSEGHERRFRFFLCRLEGGSPAGALRLGSRQRAYAFRFSPGGTNCRRLWPVLTDRGGSSMEDRGGHSAQRFWLYPEDHPGHGVRWHQ
jgi:hypothetical protein